MHRQHTSGLSLFVRRPKTKEDHSSLHFHESTSTDDEENGSKGAEMLRPWGKHTTAALLSALVPKGRLPDADFIASVKRISDCIVVGRK